MSIKQTPNFVQEFSTSDNKREYIIKLIKEGKYQDFLAKKTLFPIGMRRSIEDTIDTINVSKIEKDDAFPKKQSVTIILKHEQNHNANLKNRTSNAAFPEKPIPQSLWDVEASKATHERIMKRKRVK